LFEGDCWESLPAPKRKHDWLALDGEEGQTFQQYLEFVTMRSGRFKAQAAAEKSEIGLCPILQGGQDQWEGPSLQALLEITKAFFDRPVKLTEPAFVTDGPQGDRKRFPTFSFCQPASGGGGKFSIKGRLHAKSGVKYSRVQYHIDPLLTELSRLKDSLDPNMGMLVGVTMEDLYSHESDLFVAGMALEASKVAVFSFHRYNPFITMSDMLWHDYGYSSKVTTSTYFLGDGPRPAAMNPASPPVTSDADISEGLRRASRLLTHEICHLFGIDHCIHHRCLMLGSGDNPMPEHKDLNPAEFLDLFDKTVITEQINEAPQVIWKRIWRPRYTSAGFVYGRFSTLCGSNGVS